MKEKAHCPLKCHASVLEYETSDYQQKSGECVMDCTVQEVRKATKSSGSVHAAADCRNLVF